MAAFIGTTFRRIFAMFARRMVTHSFTSLVSSGGNRGNVDTILANSIRTTQTHSVCITQIAFFDVNAIFTRIENTIATASSDGPAFMALLLTSSIVHRNYFSIYYIRYPNI